MPQASQAHVTIVLCKFRPSYTYFISIPQVDFQY